MENIRYRVFSKDGNKRALVRLEEIIMRVLLGPTYLRLMKKLFIGWMSNWDYAKKGQQKHGEVV
jgi:sucrose-6-phosphate hydrolase SacC (GH32 family)